MHLILAALLLSAQPPARAEGGERQTRESVSGSEDSSASPDPTQGESSSGASKSAPHENEEPAAPAQQPQAQPPSRDGATPRTMPREPETPTLPRQPAMPAQTAGAPAPANPTPAGTAPTWQPAIPMARPTGAPQAGSPQAAPGVAAKGSSAVTKALKLGQQMMKSMDSGGAGAMTAGPAAKMGAAGTAPRSGPAPFVAARGGTPGAGPPAAGGSASSPRTQEDLLLASEAGYKESFTALGLQAGRDTAGRAIILGPDGRPATPEQIEALKARIAKEPAALARYPSLFNVLPRESFQKLKDAFPGGGEAGKTAFKDIALTEDKRDFKHSASCEKVSGECNEVVGEKSYKKDDFVSPEDLKGISDYLNQREGVAEAARPKRPMRHGSRGHLGGLRSRVEGLLAGMGFGGSRGDEDVVADGVSRGASSAADFGTPAGGPGARQGAGAGAAASAAPSGAVGEPIPAGRAAKRGWLWLLLALLAAAAFAAAYRLR